MSGPVWAGSPTAGRRPQRVPRLQRVRERGRRLTGAFLAALAALGPLALGGCSSWQVPQYDALIAQAPEGLPPRAEQSDTPFFAQTELQCGPAALATALGAAGIATEPAVLTPQLFVPARGGTLQLEMLVATRRQGAVSTRLPASLPALLQEVAAGHTPVVLLNLGLGLYPLWHYAVVVGYDLPAREVYLRSGQTRRLVMPLFTFAHTWQRASHWAFVALPPGQWPVSAQVDAVVDAAVGFERVQPGAPAVEVYRSALRRHPEQATLALGLGHALWASGQPQAAEQVLSPAAQAHNAAPLWNNLASVRLLLGQCAAAREAAQRAVARAQAAELQWLATAQATLADTEAALSAGQKASPPCR